MIRSRARFMKRARMGGAIVIAAICAVSMGARAQVAPAAAGTPKVGDRARDFTLWSLDGATVRLSEELARGPLVLVVLRGWPGYQCPFCTRQFGDYLTHANDFGKTGARVLFVYPGPEDGLKEHADAFKAARAIPAGFQILLDPDYAFTQAYGLRWNEPNETAYPSTLVLDKNGIVAFARTSRAHGDRIPAATVLQALSELRR
jgi:thioredoxin-dependent peroxiredoxin